MVRLIDSDEIRIKPEYMYDICGSAMIRVEDVVRIISEMPTIEPQKWIPCSKEMPEIGTMLVSNGLNVAFGEYYGNDVWIIDGCEAEPILEEIAWMPLPDPWKGEEE